MWTDNCIVQVQLKSCDPQITVRTSSKTNHSRFESVCVQPYCSHVLIWTRGTRVPSESEGLSKTARWNMWAVIIRFEEKQSNAEGGIPVLTECRHHRGDPLFTFTLSSVLSLFFFPFAQPFPSQCMRAGSGQHVAAGVRATEETWARWSL